MLGVVENGLGVNAGLVREGGVAGDVVVEGHVDADQLGHHVLDLAQQRQIVALRMPFGIVGIHAGDEAAQRRDAVALADAEHGGVDVGGAGIQRREGVGDGAAGVVVAVELDVAADDAAQGPDQFVHLHGMGDAHGIGDADAVDAHGVDRYDRWSSRSTRSLRKLSSLLKRTSMPWLLTNSTTSMADSMM